MKVESKHYRVFYKYLTNKILEVIFQKKSEEMNITEGSEDFWTEFTDDRFKIYFEGNNAGSCYYFFRKYLEANSDTTPKEIISIDDKAYSKALKFIGIKTVKSYGILISEEVKELYNTFVITIYNKYISNLDEENNRKGKENFNSKTNSKEEDKDFFSKNAPIPERFQNSKWIGYERITSTIKSKNEDKPKDIWGLYKFTVKIEESKSNNCVSVNIKTKFRAKSRNFIGNGVYDNISKCIFINLRNQSVIETEKDIPAFYFMPVHDEVSQELFVGYVVYYSTTFSRLIAKTLIWTYIHPDSKDQDFEPNEILSDNVDFEKIPVSIKKYLFSQKQNRLILPNDSISYIDNGLKIQSLSPWIAERTSGFEEDRFLSSMHGKYNICYFYGEYESFKEKNNSISKIQVDSLEIDYNPNEVEFHAKYTTINHSGSDEYKGLVRRRDSIIQIVLEEMSHNTIVSDDSQFDDGNYPTKDPINRFALLSFTLPNLAKSALKKDLKSYPFFTGILSGINQNGKPVSYIALVVKNPPKNLNNKISKFNGKDKRVTQIINFFKTQNASLKIVAPELPEKI